MNDRIPCSQYEQSNNSCNSGFPAIHSVCWGGSTGCPTCGKSDSVPMCMKEDLPPHLMRENGLPLKWPELKP